MAIFLEKQNITFSAYKMSTKLYFFCTNFCFRTKQFFNKKTLSLHEFDKFSREMYLDPFGVNKKLLFMHSWTTFLFYQTILAIGYHSVDINKDVIKLLFTFRDCHSLVSDMGGRGVEPKDDNV